MKHFSKRKNITNKAQISNVKKYMYKMYYKGSISLPCEELLYSLGKESIAQYKNGQGAHRSSV